jgi:hypothetical protein
MAMTARDIVVMAMRELAVLPSGTQPEADELADGLTKLSSMLQTWQATGSGWRDETATLTAAVGDGDIVLPAEVGTVVAARIVEPGYNRTLTRWEADDYRALPNRAQRGRPVAYAVRSDLTDVSLLLWPVPSTIAVIEYDYQRKPVAVSEASAAIDVPERYLEAVWVNLALRMSGMFGQPAPDELIARAQETRRAMLDDDRPESYIMGSDRYA